MTRVGARLPEAASVFAAVLRSRPLRRIELAFAGFSVAELATWVAILVFAYEQGGATEAGVIAVVQLVPSAIAAPLAAAFGDRYGRARFLLYGYLVQATASGATGALMLGHAPVVAVYAAAVLAAVSVTFTRPAQGSIAPLLVERPQELVAVNVASGAIESASLVIGPATAGVLIAVAGPGVVFLAMAGLVGLSAILIGRVSISEEHAFAEGSRQPVLQQSVDGLRRLARQPDAALLVGLVASEAIVTGALDVLAVVLAISLLHLGTGAPGFLTAALGVGGVLGSGAGFLLVTRRRLTPSLAVGAVLLGAPLALVAWRPGAGLAAAMLAIAGVGRVVMDVAGRSLLQRAVSADLLARAFGVMEGLYMAALAIGSGMAAILVAALGGRGALLVTGLLLPAITGACWFSLRRIETRAEVPGEIVELLRGVPMFAPLAPLSLERLATSAEPNEYAAGTAIIREGDAGDHFYLIARGSVEVSRGSRVVAVLDAGDSFGEIALIRDVARTASVVARTDVLTYLLTRDRFLRALSGNPVSVAAVDRVVAGRVAPHPPG
ncbi:MAG: cyclic nucleotide-binding domain-containing protein [Actinomycetota bacterium]